MLFKFLFASAVSQSFGMRPEGGNSRSTTLARLGEVVASAAHAVAAESMQSLQEASGIVNSILLQSGNATDHMTDDDVALLNSVIDMIDNAIYGSMDSSHQADVAAIQAAIDAASLCNSNIAARLGEDGDLNKLYLGTAGYQSTLNDLQGDVNDKTAANNSKFDELDRHINNIGSSPDCVDFPNGPTKLKADNFFAGSDFVNWYTAQQDAYAPIADAFETADQNLKDAITAYKVGLAERDVAYCDWKVELEGGCATFDQCYQDKVDHYNNELKPALQKDMQVRIDAYKAGSTIIAQIRFLLGESTESAPPTDVDTSRFQLTFQHVPPQGECDLSPLHSADWAPEPECSDEAEQQVCTVFAEVTSTEKASASVWAGRCASIPDGVSMIRIDMGDVQDYFKPVEGVTLCDMLRSKTKHLWSPDGHAWRAPTYFDPLGTHASNHLGGSDAWWPKDNEGEPADQRKYLSHWGSDTHGGGCCQSALTGNYSWGQAFSMYTCA